MNLIQLPKERGYHSMMSRNRQDEFGMMRIQTITTKENEQYTSFIVAMLRAVNSLDTHRPNDRTSLPNASNKGRIGASTANCG